MEASHLVAFASLGLTFVMAIAGLAWRMSGEFSKNRDMFWKAMEQLKEKIDNKIKELDNATDAKFEKHELRDESRFESLKEQVTQIKIHDAQREVIRLASVKVGG